MSAQVLGCGHACHLMEIDYLEEVPQVHLHFLTDTDEYEEVGFGKAELCCHGCGASLLITYNEASGDGARHLKVRDAFTVKHRRCPNKRYEEHCPNYRSSFSTVDLRSKAKEQEWPGMKKKRHPRQKKKSASVNSPTE